MLFSALFITILAAPTLEIPCDEPLGALIERLPGPATLQLAAGCRYEAPLTISGDRVVALRGRVGTTLGGGLRLQGARAITLSHLRLEGQVSLVAHRVDALTLDGVVLSGVDGVHITDSGAILLRRARIESAQSGIWLERVVSFTFVQSEVTGARVALVSHQAQRLAIIDSTLRADPRSEAEAAVVVEGGAARLLRNRLESLKPQRGQGVVLDIDAVAQLEGNHFITQGTALRTHQTLKLGCNQFHIGATRRVEGVYERACVEDIPADSLRPRYALLNAGS